MFPLHKPLLLFSCTDTQNTDAQEAYESFCETKKQFQLQVDKAGQNRAGSKTANAAIQEALKLFGAVIKSEKERREKISHALDAFNDISSWIESSLEETYTKFFSSGMQHFVQGNGTYLRASGGSDLMRPNHSALHDLGLASFFVDFIDLQMAHTNLLSSLVELSSGLELPKADTDVLFGPLSSLLAVHSQLYTALDKAGKLAGRVEDEVVAGEAIAALRAAVPVMQRWYPRFIQTESEAKSLFVYHKTHTFQFSQRLKRFPPSFDFLSTRTSGLKHLDQYISLLTPWISNYDGGDEVLRLYRDLVARCRTAEKLSEAVVPLVALKEVFDGFDDILDYYRTLVCSGTARLTALATEGAATGLTPDETYQLFVFSDCWVLARRVQDRFRFLVRGDIIAGLSIGPVDTGAADSVALQLMWMGRAPAAASEGTTTTTTTEVAQVYADSTGAAMVEHSAIVTFVCEKPLLVPDEVRVLVRAAVEQRLRTRIFGVDINVVTARPVEPTPPQPQPEEKQPEEKQPEEKKQPEEEEEEEQPPPLPPRGPSMPPARTLPPLPSSPPTQQQQQKQQQSRGPVVPQFLVEMARVIDENEGVNAVGIFRISSGVSEINRACSAIDAGHYPDITDPILAASLVRLWLRRMPEGLLTAALHDDWIAAAPALRTPGGLAACRALVARLPPSHRVVLAYLLQRIVGPVVANAAFNKMTAQNVAIVLAPSVLRSTSTDELNPISMAVETGYACSVVSYLIEHAHELFDGNI